MVFYQKDRFVTGNKIKVLNPKFTFFNCSIANFIVSVLNRVMKNLSWGTGSNIEMIKKIKFKLPVRGGKIDFDFMESFIEELEAYLKVSGFDDYELSDKEKHAIDNYSRLEWGEYEL